MLDATVWAFSQQNIKASDKLVLLSLADRANDDFECWPSYDRLEFDTCLHRRTISAAIKRLIAAGLLEKRKRFSNSNVYRLIGVVRRDGATSSAKKGTTASSAKTATTSSAKTATTSSAKTATVISKGTSQRTYQLLDGVSDAVWSEWIEYKKQTGKPLKSKATITKAQKLLAKYPPIIQQQIIDQSIQSGWSGLFEPKNNGVNGNAQNQRTNHKQAIEAAHTGATYNDW